VSPILTATSFSWAASPTSTQKQACISGPEGVVIQRCNVSSLGIYHYKPTSVYFFLTPNEATNLGKFEFDVDFESNCFDNATVPFEAGKYPYVMQLVRCNAWYTPSRPFSLNGRVLLTPLNSQSLGTWRQLNPSRQSLDLLGSFRAQTAS